MGVRIQPPPLELPPPHLHSSRLSLTFLSSSLFLPPPHTHAAMVKITSPAPGKDQKPAVRKETLIEVPLGREGRVYSATTTTRVHHPPHTNNSLPRCLLWIIMALTACSITFMGVRTVGKLRMRVIDMAKRIDVLRAEKAYLETVVGDKLTKSQFLAKTYKSNDVISFVDQEPEPPADRWAFNVNVIWTSDYITYCDMYYLSNYIAKRIYDKVVTIPREVVKVVKEDDIKIQQDNDDILENAEDKLENAEDKLIDELLGEKDMLDTEENYGSGDETFEETVEKSMTTSSEEFDGDMIAGANGDDLYSL